MSTSPQVDWQPGSAMFLELNNSVGAAWALSTSSRRAAKKRGILLVGMVATVALDAHKLQIRCCCAIICHVFHSLNRRERPGVAGQVSENILCFQSIHTHMLT
jgi:hypothetical protein